MTGSALLGWTPRFAIAAVSSAMRQRIWRWLVRSSAAPGPERLVIKGVNESCLEEWATVKLQSFGDTVAAPAPEELAQQVATRRNELGLAACQLGLLDGEGVAVWPTTGL